MKTVNRTVLVVVFLLLIEFLYLRVDPLSFGLPFRSVEYGPEDFTGQGRPFSGPLPPDTLKVDPILFVCDVLVVFLLGLLLVRCVPAVVLTPVVHGCVLGSVAGAITFLLLEMAPESWISATIALTVLLVLVPITAYALSLKHKRQKTALLAIAFVTVVALVHTGLLVEGLSDGLMEDISINLEVVLRLLTLIGVLSAECFVVMLLHRKVLPFLLRRKRSDRVPEFVARHAPGESAGISRQTGGRTTIRRAVLYTSLLAIVLYIGWHFATIKKMRDDDWTIFDALDAAMERLNVPLERVYTLSYLQDSPESLKAGWNVSFPVEICVDDEHVYHARIKKNIFVPWVQVEIQDAGTAKQRTEY